MLGPVFWSIQQSNPPVPSDSWGQAGSKAEEWLGETGLVLEFWLVFILLSSFEPSVIWDNWGRPGRRRRKRREFRNNSEFCFEADIIAFE